MVASEDKAQKHTDGVVLVCCLLQFLGTGAANAFFLSFSSVAFLLFATKIISLMTSGKGTLSSSGSRDFERSLHEFALTTGNFRLRLAQFSV